MQVPSELEHSFKLHDEYMVCSYEPLIKERTGQQLSSAAAVKCSKPDGIEAYSSSMSLTMFVLMTATSPASPH